MAENGMQQIRMFGRIDPVMTAGEHGNRAALDRGAMRRLIDAAREAGGDHKSGLAEIARQHLRELQSGAGSITRADDRNHRPHQDIDGAAHAEQRRGVVKFGKPWRITGFA
jgi:hypothetical protein